MADFQNKPLAALDAIYRIAGGLRGVSQIDLASPLTLVHDVSGQSANDQQINFLRVNTQTTGGAGVAVVNTFSVSSLFAAGSAIADQLRAKGLRPDNSTVYLMEITAAVTTATAARLVDACVSIDAPARPLAFASGIHPRLVYFANDVSGVDIPGNATAHQWLIDNAGAGNGYNNGRRQSEVILPQAVGDVSTRLQDDGAGAVVVDFGEFYSIVPRGARPSMMFTPQAP